MNTCIDLEEPKTYYFSAAERSQLRQAPTPHHIAIIPDGNRRWATSHASSTKEGHRQGGDRLIEIVKAARELGIKVITFYLFSTENWGRPKEEIAALMWLLYTFLQEQQATMLEYGIRVCTIGDLSALPTYVQEKITHTKQQTAHCQDIDMVMALNYGGRDEIRRAIQKIVADCAQNKLQIEQLSEHMVAGYLDTAPWKDPDLLIRTSGEMRLSNYLLWQISYSEIYCSTALWPDFEPRHLLEALKSYQSRQRRLGKS